MNKNDFKSFLKCASDCAWRTVSGSQADDDYVIMTVVCICPVTRCHCIKTTKLFKEILAPSCSSIVSVLLTRRRFEILPVSLVTVPQM